MGQTLTHGVYLPDEGERNCYDGLAANWQLLDGAVGTVAEHTAQIAGKAPVAHTHTKSDVTDLLNSNFIPSANNSYDLGSSSYQWNNVYAKNYYYNGVAWGLDKNNKWLTTNIFYGSVPIFLRGSDNDIYNVSPQSLVQSLISFVDKNNTTMSNIVFQHRTGATETHRLCLRQQKVTSDGYYGVTLNNLGDFYSEQNNAINLGTSTNKWKTLNGINPGALSLPSSDSADYINLSSNLSANAEYQYTAPYDGWLCLYVIVNEFYTENAIGLYRSDTSANSHQWAKSVTAALNLYKQNKYQGSVMLPVESGKKYICYLSLNANTTVHGKYLFMYKNKGNV